jgi:hypothetical protein
VLCPSGSRTLNKLFPYLKYNRVKPDDDEAEALEEEVEGAGEAEEVEGAGKAEEVEGEGEEEKEVEVEGISPKNTTPGRWSVG